MPKFLKLAAAAGAAVVLGACSTAPFVAPADGSVVSANAPVLVNALPRAPGVRYAGGDGSSQPQAVVVQSASEKDGVRGEYVWLANRYPGYQRVRQALIKGPDGPYDMLEIRLPDGSTRKVWFNISSFFGKW